MFGHVKRKRERATWLNRKNRRSLCYQNVAGDFFYYVSDGVYTTTVEKNLLNVDNISVIAVESGKKVCYHKESR